MLKDALRRVFPADILELTQEQLDEAADFLREGADLTDFEEAHNNNLKAEAE